MWNTFAFGLPQSGPISVSRLHLLALLSSISCSLFLPNTHILPYFSQTPIYFPTWSFSPCDAFPFSHLHLACLDPQVHLSHNSTVHWNHNRSDRIGQDVPSSMKTSPRQYKAGVYTGRLINGLSNLGLFPPLWWVNAATPNYSWIHRVLTSGPRRFPNLLWKTTI